MHKSEKQQIFWFLPELDFIAILENSIFWKITNNLVKSS